ncbi:iron-containing alcohol dehydrogenase [Halarcobacter ebronensis]|uniref:Butanol dehydrogenase n=1 Tax=Halarcobacter ebronensis TaxID=1462615 RepID=A0A4V1LZW5_9BACT|nr:iron-containing alcohol dehydrogenase [Halarcobacter ebronensis]QKF83062.1 iron-containing alcohol dehydrogenase [Halarcobacter ebronensis]RXK02421.1 butanol dehydrogenase [Halarcobacter ebronensis]
MARFTLPRDIYHGAGSLEELKNLKGKKAILIVGGNSMKKFGFLDKAISYLKEANLEVQTIEGIEPDPGVDTVMDGAKKMLEFEPDIIVSMGGGSAIDAAKAMWIFYEYPDFTFKEAVIPFNLPTLRQKAIFVAIPSTSGTATEVTAFSVITDYKEKIKYPMADFNITPDIAIVDPNIAKTMPQKLVAHTGMDALTHATEAYVAALHSNFSDPLAIKSLQMIKDTLIDSYNGDEKAKELMHEAQCLAGMAFTNALLGITHSMAHKVGAVFGIPHGCANAIFLPYVISYNRKACEDRYADIAKSLKLEGETSKELVDSYIDFIDGLNDKLNIPHSMKEYGIDEKEFEEHLDFIAHNAVLDACTGSNPRKIDDATMRELFICTFTGKKVDF